MKLLLSHADILTLENGAWHTLRDAYLGVEGETICYLSEAAPPEAYDRVKDLRGKLLIPPSSTATATPLWSSCGASAPI